MKISFKSLKTQKTAQNLWIKKRCCYQKIICAIGKVVVRIEQRVVVTLVYTLKNKLLPHYG